MKKLIIAWLLLTCAVCGYSQNKPRLGILPFTGGQDGDGETIANFFSIQPEIIKAFTVVLRTSAVNALLLEQSFQMSGYTDSDTIAKIGRLLNADFVVSGHIRRLGKRNLIIATIVNIESFALLAGDYREYRNIEEIQVLLPSISKKMTNAILHSNSKLNTLAVAPFSISASGVDVQDAEILAQILAIEIVNTGKYTVLPRTTTMQAAIRELQFQMSGNTLENEAKAIGKAINAAYVLSAEVRSLGTTNMFIAQILNVENGARLAGDSSNYRIVDDGIKLMPELALLLTDKAGAASRIKTRERTRLIMLEDPSKFWSIGASVGSSFADPWLIGTVSGTIAPFRNSFFGLGIDAGFITDISDAGLFSLCPFINAAYFIPINSSGNKKNSVGFYAGAGTGFLITSYFFPEGKAEPISFFVCDFNAGFIFFNCIDISYTLRTNFHRVTNKVSVGYVYRFN